MHDHTASDELRWSCGHPHSWHTREGARRCLNAQRDEGGAMPPSTSNREAVAPNTSAVPPSACDMQADASAAEYMARKAAYYRKPALEQQIEEERQRHARQLHEPSVFEESTAPLRAADFCTEAARLVGGPRAAQHGDKSLNFRNVASLWNAYLEVRVRADPPGPMRHLDGHDVACMMELSKVARRFSGSFNADDYVDGAGYAGCAGEIAAQVAAASAPSKD